MMSDLAGTSANSNDVITSRYNEQFSIFTNINEEGSDGATKMQD